MALEFEAVAFDAHDPHAVAGFWAALLDRDTVVEESGSVLVPGDLTQVGLRFVASKSEQVGPRRLHLHLTSSSLDDQQQTVEQALNLGADRVDRQDPRDEFVVLLDPEGNELCVIEPQNRFLAGTGRLGEVTCEGTREVGLFWHTALAWPLVWDQSEETAIQSPLGGTKISWGGPPVPPRRGRNRQRFDLLTSDPETEAERLVLLGATRLDQLDSGVELADPDSNECHVRRR